MRLVFIPAVIAVAACAGCAGYRLGNIGGAEIQGVKSVYIPMAKNETITSPEVQAQVTNAVINRFDADGTLKTVQSINADSELNITVIRFERNPLRGTRSDVLVTAEYELQIEAKIVFINRRTGQTIINGERIRGVTSFFVVQDLVEGTRQAVPLAAENLAYNITRRITEGW